MSSPPPARRRPARAVRTGLRRLTVEPQGLSVRRWGFRRGLTLEAERIGRIVHVPLILGWDRAAPQQLFLVITHDDVVELMITADDVRQMGQRWSPLADRLPIHDGPAGLASPRTIRAAWPETFRLWECYPVATVGILLVSWAAAGTLLDLLLTHP